MWVQGTAEAIFYTLVLMPLLKVQSIFFLFDNQFSKILNGGKDVIYRFMENQAINWSWLTLKISKIFFDQQNWDTFDLIQKLLHYL
jgi:hypothetical protein